MQVAIHAGAAFTDEGRLLNSLQKNAGLLKASGVAAFGPRRYRQVFKPAFEKIGAEPFDLTSYQDLKNVLPPDPTVQRAIFSCDHFAGEPVIALQEGQLYPHAGRRMALMEQVFDEHQVELFMSLRSPGSYIPKLLMSLPEQARDDIYRDTDLSCLSWIGMVEDIRDLAPGTQITLWSNEDTPFIWGEIVRAVCGLEKDTPLAAENDLLLSLLDEAGQSKVQALIAESSPQEPMDMHEDLARIFEDHAQAELVEEELDLPGWNAEIIGAFSELYEQDLARLATMPGVRVLRP